MKKIYLALLAGALTMSSCRDFLETESPSQQTSQNVYVNEGMAKSALMGVYAQLTNTYVYGQKMSVNWQNVSDIEKAYDTFNTGSGLYTENNFYCDWYNSSIEWRHIFKMAELASTAVEGLKNSPQLHNSESLRNMLGEAMTLRALSYFELVRRWGDIPFKQGTSNSDLSNVYMSKISRDSVYTCIVEEMKEAIEYLPWMGENGYTVERITKGFAKGLLARIALFAGGWSIRDGNQFSDENVEHYPNVENNPGMEEINGYFVGRPKNWKDFYEVAEQQCAELISDPNNPHGLDPDYGHIWRAVCGLQFNEYGENLFEASMAVGYSGNIGVLMGRHMDANLGYGSVGWGNAYLQTNGYYFYSFDPTDLRRDYACYWAGYGKTKDKNNNDIVAEKMNQSITGLALGKWSFWWTSDAYREHALNLTSGWPSTGINWILMRYSDVLLMFAEARYGLGKGTDSQNTTAGISARQALEQVRSRAFGAGSPKVTQYDPDFFKAIVNERAWELGGEGIRKLDLVRWGLLDSKLEEMKTALVDMIDNTKTITCMDKTYAPNELPSTLYYQYNESGEFIDWSSVNFYQNLDANPNPSKYYEYNMLGSYRNQTVTNTNHRCVTDPVSILLCGTGLRANYDYSNYISTLANGNLINELLVTKEHGNGVCNYRHVYSIYYQDIYRSQGYLLNSYGYENN